MPFEQMLLQAEIQENVKKRYRCPGDSHNISFLAFSLISTLEVQGVHCIIHMVP